MQHPEEGIIHAWLDGALPAGEAAALEVHVASCAECGARVADARGLVAAASRITGYLDVVPGNVIPTTGPAKKKKRLWLNSAWPAAIAATVIIGVGLYTSAGKRDASVVSGIPPMPVMSEAAPEPRPPVVAPVPAPRVAAQQRKAAEKSAPSTVARGDSVALPPVAAPMRKEVSAPAAQSSPPPEQVVQLRTAPGRSATAATASAAMDSSVVRPPAAAAGVGGAVAGGRGGRDARGGRGGVTAPFTRALTMDEQAASEAFRASVGCYEMDSTTDVLPRRFALTADSAAIPGMFAVRYLDADGRPSMPIADLGWSMVSGRIVIGRGRGSMIGSFTRTGSEVSGTTPSGDRVGRVISC